MGQQLFAEINYKLNALTLHLYPIPVKVTKKLVISPPSFEQTRDKPFASRSKSFAPRAESFGSWSETSG